MNWFIFILISIVFTGFATILQRVLLKDDKSDAIAYSVFFQTFTGILIGCFGYLMHQLYFPSLGKLLPNFIFMTLIYSFGNVFVFKALQMTEASEFTIIYAARVLFALIISSIILHEGLQTLQIVGALLVLSGVVLAAYNKKLTINKGELYAILGAFCFAVGTVNDRIILRTFPVYSYVSLAFILPALLLAVIYPKRMKNLKVFFKPTLLKKMILMCLIYGVSSITYFIALQISINTSQIVVINQSSTIITVVLAIVLLKERKKLFRKLGAAIITFLGILLVK